MPRESRAPLVSPIDLNWTGTANFSARSGRDRCQFGAAHQVVAGDGQFRSHPVPVNATVAQLPTSGSVLIQPNTSSTRLRTRWPTR